jgi:glycosyltransferase involved in cell wall biosynthesis
VPAPFGRGGVYGGAERYAFELARHMSEHMPTTLLCFGDHEETTYVRDLRVRVAGRTWYVRGNRTNPVSPALLQELLAADVIHCHQQHVVASSIAAAVGATMRKPVFVSDLGGGAWDISAYLSTDSWYSGHLHISEFSRKAFGHDSLDSARVILGGVDAERFSPLTSVERDTILYVGRILPHKGIEQLVDAATAEMRVEIIGRVGNEEYVKELRRRATTKNVVIRHDCDDDDIIAAYRRALCVVLLSKHRTIYGDYSLVPELLGQTLLEGMACGAPAICTRVASMPEIIRDGVDGYVVDPDNVDELRERLVGLCRSAPLVSAMGSAARARVLDKFTWRAVIDRCLLAYSKPSRRRVLRLGNQRPSESVPRVS